jgi:hypothetical protein
VGIKVVEDSVNRCLLSRRERQGSPKPLKSVICVGGKDARIPQGMPESPADF